MDEESIFAEAVKLQSDAERQAFLDDACKGNVQLRAEVEELLRAHVAAGSFLDQSPVTPGLKADADSEPEEIIETDAAKVSLHFLEPCNNPGRIGKLVPQITVVSPPWPRLPYFHSGLPGFPSRSRDVWSSRRLRGDRCRSNEMAWRTCG